MKMAGDARARRWIVRILPQTSSWPTSHAKHSEMARHLVQQQLIKTACQNKSVEMDGSELLTMNYIRRGGNDTRYKEQARGEETA